MLALLLILAAPPPDPDSDPPFAGSVASVGGIDPYWEAPCVAVDGRNTIRHAWPPRRVTVRLAGMPGTWPADVLLVGDRVVVSGPSYYWSDHPTLTVYATRDFDIPLILATERSVVRFAAAGDARPATFAPPFRAATRALGCPCYATREAATAVLATSGRAGVRAAAWAESSADCEVRFRAGLAIDLALRGGLP